jgi:hypothetical protein
MGILRSRLGPLSLSIPLRLLPSVQPELGAAVL